MALCGDHAQGNTPRYKGTQRPRTGCEKCWELYRSLHPERAEAVEEDAKGLRKLEMRLLTTQRTLDKTQKLLGDAKEQNQYLRQRVYDAVKDSLEALAFDPIKPPTVKHSTHPEIAVAVMSDWQLGKKTPTYDSDVCEQRVEEYGDKVLRLTDIQRAAHPVDELHVWLLGDMVEGEMIFPGQAHLIDSSVFRQAMVNGPRILGDFLRRMAGAFAKVHVVGVIGNHGSPGGRARREYNPETNWDRVLYWFVKELFAASGQDNVTFDVPFEINERAWYAIDDIGGYRTLLMHGDQLKWGPRAPSTFQKILSWKAGGLNGQAGTFDDVIAGHWHQTQRMRVGNTTVRMNGSTESTNTYAQEWLANMDDPSQWLMYVRPGRGVTAEYQVWLSTE